MMVTRTITATITDQNNDVSEETLNFEFTNVKELDRDIDDHIINVMEVSRVEVLIEDFDQILSDEEVEWLESKFYEVH